MGLLDGKVAIITGSGGGIGRCHALLFAKEGAKVVVNDLGGTRDGAGSGNAMADQVVAEIKAAGGDAVANYDSVATLEGAAGIMKTAIDAYGRADILVNNAGILRDKTLLKLDEGMWDLVIAVHLKGTFACGQAFAAHVKERAADGDKGGRIINTSSYAGLMGNYGQTNYAAAKAGIYAMTKVWALELAKLGINVNCIAPMAKTRMTEDIDMIPDEMTAEQVAPMVLFLASDLADDLSGKIYGIHGRQLLEYKMLMTEGVTKEGADWTAAEIATKLDAIGAEQAPPAGAGAAAAAPMSDQQIIDKAFEMLPQVFLPGRAKGWTAAVVFDIQGGDPWTMVVKDGTCSTSKTKHDSPTCVVTVDKATYASVVKGELKPEKAFMAGKIKATNLADMMKFGSAFDMKKARALAEAEKAKANAGGSASAAAAPKTLTDAEIIDRAFELLPKVFVPGRAKGWTAAIVFDIQGASSWTVEIKDGTCKTVRSKSDSPTCVVTVDAETYAAVVKGKLKPEKAFMAGKIKATNLGDMMKFGSAFDMKKARQVAEEAKAAIKSGSGDGATASPAAAGPAALVATAFNALPKAFKPDAVSGWSAVLQFEIGGGDDWTVTIQDGTCTTEVGKHGTATCVIKTKLEDYARVVSGELKAEQAFMQGKISASNLGEMMKFGRAFDVKKAAELIRAAASGGGSGAVEESGLNRACLGKEFTGEEPLFVRPEQALAFAEATEDGNSVYRGGGEGVYAPPMFAVRMLKDVMFKAAGDPELKADLMNLVHGEQDMEFLRPLKTWDLCATRATITGIEDKSTGQLLRIEESVLTAGEEAVRVRASMFIRDPSKKKPKGETPKEAPTEAAPREITFSDTVTVAADQGPRYAEAGGDNNPIHTDDEIAKLAGFKGIILQGLCTMSFACKAVVDKLADGDPAKLKRIAVRFTKPVLMGETLTTEGWSLDPKDGRSVYGFRVVNQDGVEVITNGIAELVG